MTAEIHKMPEPKARLHCTTCHEEGFAPCNCQGTTFISTAEARVQRKQDAHARYRNGETEEQIAGVWKVTQDTIKRDLADFDLTTIVNSKRAKTATDPKGAGRKKGTKGKKRSQPSPKHDEARSVVRELVEAGKSISRDELAAKLGVSVGTIQRAELAERARLEARADPVVDPSTLSLSAQEKLAAALRQQKLIHEREYQQRLEDAVVKWTEETGIKHFVEQYDNIRYVIERRGGVMTSRNYALVLSCLHPDSRHSLSDEKMAEAFRIFAALKLKLCDNKEVPVTFPPMPTTRAEWEARREAVRQQRKAARSSKASTNRPVSQA